MRVKEELCQVGRGLRLRRRWTWSVADLQESLWPEKLLVVGVCELSKTVVACLRTEVALL
jgi:hypothetical protein